MISHEIYKWLHLIGAFLLFAAFGGAILREAPAPGSKDVMRGRLSMLHGIGLLLLLVAGFGMLARVEAGPGLPGWAWAKLALWLALGGWIVPAHRRKFNRSLVLGGAVAIGALAAWLGIWK
jgi:hypothetical protein